MKKLEFAVRVSTDKQTGRLLAAYFQIRKGYAAKVREFADGNAFANYSRKGELLGIEVLGPCEIEVFDKIAGRESKAREFVRRAIPRELAIA